jgi:aminocarboxymuconate-semialdehyde decarboxylase
MSNSVGNPLETTIVAAHLIMAGVMEAHPRCKVVLAHGGGAILSLRGRLRHAHTVVPQAKRRLHEPVDTSLRLFYFDTVTHDADLLRALIAYAGPDHVLLGSDYPFDMGVARPAEPVRALGLSAEDEAKVLGGNAAHLLGLEA